MKRFLLFAGILLLCGTPLFSYGFYQDSDDVPPDIPPVKPDSESSNLCNTRALSIEIVKVDVFDADQQLLYTGTAIVYANQLMMDTSALAKGTYIVVAKTAGKPDRMFTVVCD